MDATNVYLWIVENQAEIRQWLQFTVPIVLAYFQHKWAKPAGRAEAVHGQVNITHNYSMVVLGGVVLLTGQERDGDGYR